MIDNEYKKYFKKDDLDYDEIDYYYKKRRRKLFLIFGSIGLVITLFVLFNITAFTMDNPYGMNKNIIKNDFEKIDEIIESGNNFHDTDYY